MANRIPELLQKDVTPAPTPHMSKALSTLGSSVHGAQRTLSDRAWLTAIILHSRAMSAIYYSTIFPVELNNPTTTNEITKSYISSYVELQEAISKAVAKARKEKDAKFDAIPVVRQ